MLDQSGEFRGRAGGIEQFVGCKLDELPGDENLLSGGGPGILPTGLEPVRRRGRWLDDQPVATNSPNKSLAWPPWRELPFRGRGFQAPAQENGS